MEEVPREANRDFRELSFRPTAFAGMAPYQSGDVLKVDGNRVCADTSQDLKWRFWSRIDRMKLKLGQ